MTEPTLHIAAAGVSTAAGTDIAELVEAIREDRRFVKTTHLVGVDGRNIVAAHALPMASDHGLARPLALVEPALRECLAGSDKPPSGGTLLVVCVSRSQFTDGPSWKGLVRTIATILHERHGVFVPESLISLYTDRHASGLRALARVREAIITGEAREAIVVGIHSDCEPMTLVSLDLLGITASSRSPHGHLPGEGAAVVHLRPEGPGPRIAGFSFRSAPTIDYSKPEHCDAELAHPESLVAASEEALAQWRGERRTLTEVITDLTGEEWRAKEWALVSTRVLWQAGATPSLLAPAFAVGDLCAAAVPLGLAIAGHCVEDSGLPRLLTASVADKLRGAVIIDR